MSTTSDSIWKWVKNTLVIIVILILICGMVAYLFDYWPFNKSKEVKMEMTTISTGELANYKLEIARLKNDSTSRNSAIYNLNNQINILKASLAECNDKKSKVTVIRVPAKPVLKKASSLVIDTTQVDSTFIVKKGAKLSRTIVVIEKGEEKLCWQLAPTVWYPAIAVEQNDQKFPNLRDNGQKGYDLIYKPSGTIGSTGSPSGIAEDGTHWIEVNELQRFSASMPRDWVPKVMINGVFKTAEVTEVNGKQYFFSK